MVKGGEAWKEKKQWCNAQKRPLYYKNIYACVIGKWVEKK